MLIILWVMKNSVTFKIVCDQTLINPAWCGYFCITRDGIRELFWGRKQKKLLALLKMSMKLKTSISQSLTFCASAPVSNANPI